jgi:uncharacterized membrane protein (DUF4010 family)
MIALHYSLLLIAAVAAVHAIWTANHMTKRVPLSIAFEIILMFAFAVGTLAAGWNGETAKAGAFLIASILAKTVSIVDMLCRGYPVSFSIFVCEINHLPTDRR